MLRLTFIGAGTTASTDEPSPYYRVAAGSVWTRSATSPLTTFVAEHWRYQGRLWSGLRFEGHCRLILGPPSVAAGVSETLQSVSVSGRVLAVNGLPLALYDPALERWRAVVAHLSWPVFRIESAADERNFNSRRMGSA